MNKIVKNSWALFLGMSMIMLSYGYQSSLLGVRAVVENFSLASTGFMMSGYFVGYFIGARTATPVISSVGHIRAFYTEVWDQECFYLILVNQKILSLLF